MNPCPECTGTGIDDDPYGGPCPYCDGDGWK